MTDKRYFYTTIADSFDAIMNRYDLSRRLEVVFADLLPEDITGSDLLDVGCGTGWFSKEAHQRGANVIALDMGVGLLKQAQAKAPVRPLVGDTLALPIAAESVDYVVSSEVIEHTLEPGQAVAEMARTLKPGGVLILTCPNRAWQWLVDLAVKVKMRPYDGYEHFPGFGALEQMVVAAGLTVEAHIGLHPWPFQIRPLWGLSRVVDRTFGAGLWGRVMINQAIRARKS